MVRRATAKDIKDIDNLLIQVRHTHTLIRPDLFKEGTKKYTDEELKGILESDNTPVFVYEENGVALGHAFCILEDYTNSDIWVSHKTLYIDDICVDERCRGRGIAHKLFDAVKEYAKSINCYNITLNVWEGNTNAEKLYRGLGFKTYKTGMEIIL